MNNFRPVVLVHGLWDKPKVFHRLIQRIEDRKLTLLVPYLPHELGRTPISTLSTRLDDHILSHYGNQLPIDIVGFSMGGLIARNWLQKMGGSKRTKRFISIGCPHNGTFTAQCIPSCLLAGIADMKRGSSLLSQLNNDLTSLEKVECTSFFTKWDLMSFPGWQAKLSIGDSYHLPVLTHKELITNSSSLDILVNKIFNNS